MSSTTKFTGILNEFGDEKEFTIYLNPDAEEEYSTDFLCENVRSDAIINDDICTIKGIKYQIGFFESDNEILIVGKEIMESESYLFKSKKRFFVATNDENVFCNTYTTYQQILDTEPEYGFFQTIFSMIPCCTHS
jgi:hypothetical protein